MAWVDRLTVSWDAACLIIIMYVCFPQDVSSVEENLSFLSCLGDRAGCKESYHWCRQQCLFCSWKKEHLSIDCCLFF